MEEEKDPKKLEHVLNSFNENNINNSYNNNNISKNNISINIELENIPILEQLIEIGFNKIYSKRVIAIYHPRTFEEALNYFLNEDGIIQHFYIEDRESSENKVCFLCGERKEIHLGYMPENNNKNVILKNETKSKSILNKKFINDYSNEDNNISKDLIINKNNLFSNNSFNKEECPICSNLFIPCPGNKLKICGHSFCNDCWYNFLSIKIEENKLTLIKCLNYECQEKLSDEFIINLLNSNKKLIEKYKKYKLELDIINDTNKKFCPYPNCNSYAELKDIKEKYVKCLNNHMFCFLCSEKPHGNKPCEDKLDKSLIKYFKNNFVKKCPHCGIITEKSEGCNHITCSKCSYQWCWLCNGKYNIEHFREGKCRGYQFFKPKNEEDIKLAFEGKITLKESQRQGDLADENDENPGRAERIRPHGNIYDDFHFHRRRGFHNREVRITHNLCFKIKRIPNSIKILLSLVIYLFFGLLILLYKPFYKRINEYIMNENKFYNYVFKPGIKLLYLLIVLSNFFPQIIFNFIILMIYMMKCRTCFLIESIKKICFFEPEYYDDLNMHENFLVIFLNFINVEVYLCFYNYYAKKVNKKKRKIILTNYFLIGFLNIFSYIQYFIFFGILNLITHLLYHKNIKKDFENIFERNLILDH